MDLIYYRSEIKKIIEEYDGRVNKTNRQARFVFYIVIALSLLVISISVASRNFFLLIIIGFLFFLYLIFFIIKYYLLKSTFYKHMHRIQETVFNGEGKYNIQILEKSNIIELLKEVRFAERYDYINVFEGYKVTTSDYEGYYFNVCISRSTGNSSMVIINGEVYILKLKTLSNYQIRNDYYRVSKLKRFKFPNYCFYADKEITEVDDDNFYFIKRMFPESKYIGINYSPNYIAVFNKIRFKNPTSFLFNDQNIKIHFQRLMMKFENLDKQYQEFKKDSF